jgi:nuclease S1
VAAPASAWGPEGHSIVAEVAQQRLSEPATQLVRKLLKGRSLASIASTAR